MHLLLTSRAQDTLVHEPYSLSHVPPYLSVSPLPVFEVKAFELTPNSKYDLKHI
jgi:hypothetical protein